MLGRIFRALGLRPGEPAAAGTPPPARPGQPGYLPPIDRPSAPAGGTQLNPRSPDQCYFCARPAAKPCERCGRPVCPADAKPHCPLCSLGSREPWLQQHTIGDWAARRLRPYLHPIASPPRTVLDVFAPQIQADVLALLEPAAPIELHRRFDALKAWQATENPAAHAAIAGLISPDQPLPVIELAAQLLQQESPAQATASIHALAAQLAERLAAADDERAELRAYRIAGLLGSLGIAPPALPADDPAGRIARAKALLDGGTALDLFRLEELERAG